MAEIDVINPGKSFNFSVLLFPVTLTSRHNPHKKKCRVLNARKTIVKHFATSTDLDFFTLSITTSCKVAVTSFSLGTEGNLRFVRPLLEPRQPGTPRLVWPPRGYRFPVQEA